jgi:predicted CXXCH cytochrome family protein
VLLFPGCAISAQTEQPQATPVRQADASCQPCHESIFGSYLSTPMANASGAAAENLKTANWTNRSSGVMYSISQGPDGATLVSRDPAHPSATQERRLSYFLGSGHLGVTYLYSVDGYLFESPVAWYAESQSYDMKPGLGEMRQEPPALPMQSGCLRCHMSAVQEGVPGTVNRYQGLAFLHTGITCEACHGESAEHVRTASKAAIVNPAHLNADRRDSVCIVCHLEGDVTVERFAHSVLSFRPGESVSTYLAYYVRSGAGPTARGVSEVEQLAQSVCKRVSGEKMWCGSCHDPHFSPARAQRAAFYRGKCLACHAEPDFAATHHPENPDCTACHMRKTGAENIPHVAWTDHRILRVPGSSPGQPGAPAGDDLRPIFSPQATKRDLAMAYYRLLLEGERKFEVRAWEQLMEQKQSFQNDPEALDALGNLSAERGDLKTAEQAFRRVLELAPADLTALSNLGTILAKQGKLDQSTELLGRAFERNRDVPGLAMNLARVECAAGDGQAARNALQAALVYNPGLEDLERLLAQMSSCRTSDSKP